MKLYVIASNDLSKPQQFVQATHAVAQYLIDNPQSKWKNETLVMLKSNHLNEIKSHLDYCKSNYSMFHEPYYNNMLTAIAFDEYHNVVDDLKLI